MVLNGLRTDFGIIKKSTKFRSRPNWTELATFA